MARRKHPEWTKQRLRDLEADFKKMTPALLQNKWGRPFEVLVSVHEFAVISKRLQISTKTVTQIRGGKKRKYRITVYAPGFADGAHRMHD